MHSLRLLWAAHNEQTWLRRRRRVQNRRLLEKISEMPEILFIEHFRLNKYTYYELCLDLKRLTKLKGSNELPLEIKVLCALSFFATGSYQRIVGVTQHIVQRTASRCIREVVDALSSDAICFKWIVFPQTHEERSKIKQEFQRRFSLPGVIGCVDCTHVAIVKPSENEHLYINRKGYHSLNVQMICDANLRIMALNSKFGGSAHDSHIWSASRIEQYMRELHQHGEHVWLLGDSGYPQRPWLMTPILNAAPGSREDLYTSRHVQARNCIERCFGLLKSRWRCLIKDRTLHYHPLVASKIVVACSVLHNITLTAAHLTMPLEPVVDDGDDDAGQPLSEISDTDGQSELIQGRAMLNSLLSRL